MKKQSVLGLVLTVALLSACGGNTENKATTTATEEVNAAENSGAEETQKETETEESEDATTYAEQKGIEFGTPTSFSKDYSILFVDESNYEEVDNEDFHVIDKGFAEFNFYNVKTWPAEKDGYTTAMLTFTVDSTNKSHAPEEWGNVRSWKNIDGIDLFDYYTGKYIPVSEKYSVNTTGSEQTDPVETEIDFGDKKWDLTSWSEEKAISNWEGYNYTDVSHYDYTENFSKVKYLYVTYPNDYDGLSFAVQSKGEAKVDMDSIKSAANNDRDKYIGKDILSVYEEEGIKKEDILFCSMKDASSLIIEEVASAEDAAAYIPTYEEREGLTNYSDSSLTKGFSLPYEFYVFDENGELLGEDKVQAEKGSVDYEIVDVNSESTGEDTKVSISYKANKKINVDVANYDGEFTGRVVNPDIEAYYSNNGESIKMNADFAEDNTDWGDWEDDTHISYNVDYTYNAELTIPTDNLDDAVVNFGDRKSLDSIRFKLSDLLSA